MNDPRRHLQPTAANHSPISTTTKEEWEDWEDDNVPTPISSSPFNDPPNQLGSETIIISQTAAAPSRQPSQQASTAAFRMSISKIRRVKSKQRQKAQNARFGIKLVTDMSILRQQQQQKQKQQHVAAQMRQDSGNRVSRTGKFVDAAALLALEGKSHGDPSSPFEWLRRRPTKGKKVERAAVVESPVQPDLSPTPAPIMIGFEMPEGSDVVISPQTAVVETPVDYPFYLATQQTRAPPPSRPPVSAWSPDTDDAFSPQSQIDAALADNNFKIPAVPAIPQNYQNNKADRDTQRNDAGNHRDTTTTVIYFSDDDDMGTPVTLFEEDGSPVAQRKSYKANGRQRSATDASTRSQGWWDQVTSPFVPTPATPKAAYPGESPAEEKNRLWAGSSKKNALTPVLPSPVAQQPSSLQPKDRSQDWWDMGNQKRTLAPVFSDSIGGESTSSRAAATPQNQFKTQDQKTAFSPMQPESVPQISGSAQSADKQQNWWDQADRKKPLTPPVLQSSAMESAQGYQTYPKPHQRPPQIIIQDFSPMEPTQPSSSESVPAIPRTETHAEKARILLEESRNPSTPELPPPYSPPSEPKKKNVQYTAVLPPGHELNDMYPPSPGPVPVGLSNTMTSQGAISLTDVPLTPAPVASRLPERQAGTALPGDHFYDVSGRGVRQKAERKRRRHEKEDVVARKATRMWRGRGCFSSCDCFGLGRAGAAGRKRRRVWLGILAAVLALTILGVVLGIVLSRRKSAPAAIPSRFVNFTDFPPMPTGISTVIGPESDTTATCVNPPTLWSCSLPKEQADSVKPFTGSQPSFVLHIQFDNDSRQLWNVPPGETPRPTPVSPAVTSALASPTVSSTARPTPTSNSTAPTATSSPRALSVRSGGMSFTEFVHRLVRRQNSGSLPSEFKPVPSPPAFGEMFFLGNTTDGVVSNNKAGEPTPFYITMLQSVDDLAEPNSLNSRDILSRQNNGGRTGANSSSFPPPVLNPDGTGAPATLLAFPKQQPVRLYDRGLPTERYSFYTYYNKTIYLQSTAPLNAGGNSNTVRADQNGGSLRNEAKFVVTWLQTRYKVEIWTRMSNSTRLVGGFQGAESDNNSTQPGTFPYPITITLDTHGGGDVKGKLAFSRSVDNQQRILLTDEKLVLNNLNATGDVVNSLLNFNPSFGGFDGGTGGCKCEYRNFVGLNRRVGN